MGRDGYISIAILTSLVGLMVAVDSSAAVATRWIGGSVCVATILVTAYLLAIPEALRTVFRRGAQALLPIVVLAGAVIVVLIRLPELDPGTRNAMITGSILMAGWLATFLTQELRRATEREERRADLIEALTAEARKIHEDAGKLDVDATIRTVREKFAVSENYKPFVFYGHNYDTFKRVMSEIEILPTGQIEAVVNFYQLMDRLERMEKVLGSKEFADLTPERSEDGLVRFLRLHGHVAKQAEKVISLSKNRKVPDAE